MSGSLTMAQRVEWKNKLGGRLRQIQGVIGVEPGEFGILVRVSKNTTDLEKKLEDFFEKHAPDLPYAIRVGPKEHKEVKSVARETIKFKITEQ